MSGKARNTNPFYATTKSIAELALEARKQVSAGKKAPVPKEREATPSTYHYSTISSNYGTQIQNNKKDHEPSATASLTLGRETPKANSK